MKSMATTDQQSGARLVGLHDARSRIFWPMRPGSRRATCCSSSRDGFEVAIYDTLEEFYCAEALEYVRAWQQATPDNPVGICGPIGPTEQLPLVARIVNALGVKLHDAHFWGMDEWIENGRPVPMDHPLSFAKADMELCFNRIRPELRMPDGEHSLSRSTWTRTREATTRSAAS